MTSSIGMDPVDVALTNERNGYSSFDHDYNPSPEAIAKVNEVFDYIEANPEKWDQDTYGNQFTETNCFMGILCRINGVVTSRFTWLEDNGDVPDDFSDYGIWTAKNLLDMEEFDHQDRAMYIADFIEVPNVHTAGVTLAEPYRHPTLDEMRERVSIAMGHDFRKPENTNDNTNDSTQEAFNDPIVGCCGRDAADCDC